MIILGSIWYLLNICCIYFPPSNSGRWRFLRILVVTGTLRVDPIKPWTPKALLKRFFWDSDTCSACVWISREYIRHITLLNLNRLSNAETSYPWNVFSRTKFQGCASDPFLWISRCLRRSNLPGCTFRLAQKVDRKKVKIGLGTPNLSFHIWCFFWVNMCILFSKKVSIFAQYALPYSGAIPSLPATRYLREKSQNRKV